MNLRHVAMLVAASASAVAGVALFACNPEKFGAIPFPDYDGGTQTTRENPQTREPVGDDDGPSDAGSDASLPAPAPTPCDGVEPVLRSVTNDKGFFCEYYTRDGGASPTSLSTKNCASSETCCNPARGADGFPPSFCATGRSANACADQAARVGSQWPAPTSTNLASSWQCSNQLACGSGESCCLFRNPSIEDASKKLNIGKFPSSSGCSGLVAYNAGGTRCTMGACPSGEFTICSSNTASTACKSGEKCVPFRSTPVKGAQRDLGYCAP